MTRSRVTVLSPHRDDAALSLGGLLQRLGPRVDVVTVFSRTAWTWREGHRAAAVAQVTRLRGREDRMALALLGVRCSRALGLEEVLLRGYASAHVDDPGESLPAPDLQRVAARLLSLWRRSQPGLVLIPLGLGFHLDHRLVHQAAATVCDRLNLPALFYEDLPYATGIGRAKARWQAQLTTGADCLVRVGLSRRQMQRKLDALAAYPSQLRRHDLKHIVDYSRWGSQWMERLHGTRPAAAALLGALRRHRGD